MLKWEWGLCRVIYSEILRLSKKQVVLVRSTTNSWCFS
jgi:hypothetical protein